VADERVDAAGFPWMLQTCFVPGGNPIYPYMTGDTAHDNIVHVNASDQEKIDFSLLMLLGTFFFITFVLKLSKWKLTPMLGSILVMSFFVWAGKQLYVDFTRGPD
jgi:hypothetical protein